MTVLPSDPEEASELMFLTAEELERRGEKMLKLSRNLLAQAAHHATMAALPEERSTTRQGVVSEKEAIDAAREMVNFTRGEFAERLGLTPSGVSRWLAKLLDRESPIIMRGDDGYHYLPPPSEGNSTARPRRTTPEQQAVTDAPERGGQVRQIDHRKRAKISSVPGQGHAMRQKDRRREEADRVKREREDRRRRK